MSNTFRSGWVYVLSHPFYADHLKIGFTERSVEERIAELESHTGAPRGLTIEYAVFTSEPRRLESAIHQHLRTYRTWQDKEFFRVPVLQASEQIRLLAAHGKHKIYEEIDPQATRKTEEERRVKTERRQKEEEARKADERARLVNEERARFRSLAPMQKFEEEASKIRNDANEAISLLSKPGGHDLAWTWVGGVCGMIGIAVFDNPSDWWGGGLLGAAAGYFYDQSQHNDKRVAPYLRERKQIMLATNRDVTSLAVKYGVFDVEKKKLFGNPYVVKEIPSRWMFPQEEIYRERL